MIQKTTLFIFALFTSAIFAQTVNIEGNPYGGNPYENIASAIEASNDGDVILITGIHTESIAIDKSITLRGEDPTTDIIQAAETPNNDGSGSRVVSLSRVETAVLNITIENLGIRNGNAGANFNGGGIDADKITGLLTLRNLIVENNHSARNGGGLSFAGSNAEVISCIVRNNSAGLDGGGILATPNNASGTNSNINIKQSLISNNVGRNGGGIYINGNNGFGNNFKINVNIENSTVVNNSTFSNANGNGGGAIFSASAFWTGDGVTSNITLKLIHTTFNSNFHASANKAGLQFAGVGQTNFSAYNSIIVNTDEIATKALNFANTNTTNVVNCILGGLNAPPALIDEEGKNNLKGRTATQAGLSDGLSDQGGNTLVIALNEATNAVDFCTATTGIDVPTIDQRGFNRTEIQDAGAFEFAGTLLSNHDQNLTQVSLYPNPSNTYFKINGLENISSVKVYSMIGALEKEFLNQNQYDVSDLSKGVHIIVIQNGNQSFVERILVQ